MNNKSKPNALDVVEEIWHQAALYEAKHAKSTPEDRKWSRELGQMLEARVAELRRNLTPADAPIEKAPPIPPILYTFVRDELIARITAIATSMGGAVQFAHRNLTGLSDDDLRRLLATLDPTLRQ